MVHALKGLAQGDFQILAQVGTLGFRFELPNVPEIPTYYEAGLML